jgi:AGZA family xanthine/uracil permease-like MFS transporter
VTKWAERQFKLEERGTNARTEIIAGITTFMTMGYIIFVNPGILSETGMPFDALMVSTCLAAALATFTMAFLANFPVALASGMGLNAFFAYTVVLTMRIPWQTALAAVFIEGVIFIALTFSGVRERVVNGIPMSLKQGISAGIGLFIAFIGFQNSGIIVPNEATLVTAASLRGNIPGILTIAGLVLIGVMESLKVRGAILLGIIATTALAMLTGAAPLPEAVVSMPPSIAPIFAKMDFSGISLNLRDPAAANFWIVVFTFFFVDFFDTVGTLVGVAARADLLDERGNMPKAREALLADAIGTAAGAVLGVSTVTSYAESASGVGAGGRTGLTSLVTGILFVLAIFFSPIVRAVPAFATAPTLIFVGMYMFMNVTKLDFSDWTEFLPAMMAIFTMPFAYSIAAGIEFAFITYAALKLATGRAREVSAEMWVISSVFILKEMLF